MINNNEEIKENDNKNKIKKNRQIKIKIIDHALSDVEIDKDIIVVEELGNDLEEEEEEEELKAQKKKMIYDEGEGNLKEEGNGKEKDIKRERKTLPFYAAKLQSQTSNTINHLSLPNFVLTPKLSSASTPSSSLNIANRPSLFSFKKKVSRITPTSDTSDTSDLNSNSSASSSSSNIPLTIFSSSTNNMKMDNMRNKNSNSINKHKKNHHRSHHLKNSTPHIGPHFKYYVNEKERKETLDYEKEVEKLSNSKIDHYLEEKQRNDLIVRSVLNAVSSRVKIEWACTFTPNKFKTTFESVTVSSVPSTHCLLYHYASLNEITNYVRCGMKVNSHIKGILFSLHHPNELTREEKSLFKNCEALVACSLPRKLLFPYIPELMGSSTLLPSVSPLSSSQQQEEEFNHQFNNNNNNHEALSSKMFILSNKILLAMRGTYFGSIVDPRPWFDGEALLSPHCIKRAYQLVQFRRIEHISRVSIPKQQPQIDLKQQPHTSLITNGHGETPSFIINNRASRVETSVTTPFLMILMMMLSMMMIVILIAMMRMMRMTMIIVIFEIRQILNHHQEKEIKQNVKLTLFYLYQMFLII